MNYKMKHSKIVVITCFLALLSCKTTRSLFAKQKLSDIRGTIDDIITRGINKMDIKVKGLGYDILVAWVSYR